MLLISSLSHLLYAVKEVVQLALISCVLFHLVHSLQLALLVQVLLQEWHVFNRRLAQAVCTQPLAVAFAYIERNDNHGTSASNVQDR